MDTKKTIRKVLFISIWLVIGSGMLVLLIAAIGKQKKDTCKDYVISIKGINEGELFLQKSDITRLLKASTHGNIKGQPKKVFDLQQMEELLEDNVWVKEARLYFDTHEVLHVSVTEREPIARVFTAGGRSFYLDQEGKFMQLSDRVSAKLPVFTGFPDKKKLNAADSSLLKDLINTATFISHDKFWNAQVAQVDIVTCGPTCWEFEMIPLIGNHLVKLGDGQQMQQKFARLFTFYKEVLSKSGFDKYKTDDVRYEGQVVAGKSANPKVDAEQLRKSVDKLLQQIKEAEAANEVAAATVKVTPVTDNVASTQSPDARPVNVGAVAKNDNEKPKETQKPVKENAKPKAVMPKKG